MLIGTRVWSIESAISNDFERLSEIFNDRNHRAASLRQLSFLFCYRSVVWSDCCIDSSSSNVAYIDRLYRSKLCRLNRIRSSLRDRLKRLNSLLILSTYADDVHVSPLDMQMIVNNFISCNDYRRKLFCNLWRPTTARPHSTLLSCNGCATSETANNFSSLEHTYIFFISRTI